MENQRKKIISGDLKYYLRVMLICIAIFINGFITGGILSSYPDEVIDKMQKYSDSITFMISLVALVFAMITYFSIDLVEKKNKMEDKIGSFFYE